MGYGDLATVANSFLQPSGVLRVGHDGASCGDVGYGDLANSG